MHIDYLRQCLDNEAPVDASIHARFRELLHQYVIVGGMPEAVTAFLNTRQIGKVLSIQRRIVDEYKADMVKMPNPCAPSLGIRKNTMWIMQ